MKIWPFGLKQVRFDLNLPLLCVCVVQFSPSPLIFEILMTFFSFLCTEIFRHIEDKDVIKARAQEIFDKFCTAESPQAVNLDYNAREVLRKGLAKPASTMFRDSQKVTWKVLKNEWFPVFCSSSLFQQFNVGPFL